MAVDADPGAVREIIVVLALAFTGLLLAAFAAFIPRAAGSTGSGRDAVVEMHLPSDPENAELAAPGTSRSAG